MKNYSSEFLSYLNGKKIIIAGCDGYIGTELSNQLEINNIEYIGIDKTLTKNNRSLQFNLMDSKMVQDIVSKEKPNYFFHLATHSALEYKNNFLHAFYEDNTALYNILNGHRKFHKDIVKAERIGSDD